MGTSEEGCPASHPSFDLQSHKGAADDCCHPSSPTSLRSPSPWKPGDLLLSPPIVVSRALHPMGLFSGPIPTSHGAPQSYQGWSCLRRRSKLKEERSSTFLAGGLWQPGGSRQPGATGKAGGRGVGLTLQPGLAARGTLAGGGGGAAGSRPPWGPEARPEATSFLPQEREPCSVSFPRQEGARSSAAGKRARGCRHGGGSPRSPRPPLHSGPRNSFPPPPPQE